MRWLLATVLVAVLAATLYVASPFRSAWLLREAIRNGDVATLETKIEWTSVRESLRASLAEMQSPDTAEGEPKPSLWQRGKAAITTMALNRMVESYVTPQGLPLLFARHQQLKAALPGDAAQVPATWQERVADLYRRLKRAEFQTPTRVEIEVADRYSPDRRYISVLELIGFDWKLTSLRVVASSHAVGLAELD
jgi:hypothetical protein